MATATAQSLMRMTAGSMVFTQAQPSALGDPYDRQDKIGEMVPTKVALIG